MFFFKIVQLINSSYKIYILSLTGILMITISSIDPFSVATAAPIYGGTIVTVPGVGNAPPAAINDFNPLLSTSFYDSQAAQFMYQPLLWINRELHVDYKLSIAKKIIVGPEHRTFTICFHKFWRWSDGTPVNASDLIYTFELIKKLGPRFPGYDVGGIPNYIKSIDKVNNYEVRIVTTRSVNPTWFEMDGLAMLTPLPEQAWGGDSISYLYDHMTNNKFFNVVDGPFIISQYKSGRYVSFIPNKNFTGHDKPYISHLVLKFLHSSISTYFAMKSGAIQIGDLPASLYKAHNNLPGYRLITVGPSWSFNFLGFNYANKDISFVRNRNIRWAIASAINQKMFIKILGHGYGARAYGVVPSKPERFLSPKAHIVLSKGIYNLQRADVLLRSAGWIMHRDHFRYKNGRKLQFTIYVPASSMRAPILLSAMLRKIGVDVHLRERPFNEIMADFINPLNHHWQAIYMSWGSGYFPTDSMLFKCGGKLNGFHYCDKRFDYLASKLSNSKNINDFYKYQDYFTTQQPVIILPNTKVFVMTAKNIHGLARAFSPLGTFNPQFLWIGKKIK
ncbi:peptide ABC transporter substrate-binding protein [Acidithiobacillus thiooxidans]|uniref:Oligopeptide-binding protein AppA n=1 Tax=Acidithiobacillus thiooxidans ATCC 19377 TaxID=637390 RepID=A0A543Q005_ACITH|nr:peptide ABC transporter substrate-binding protein [Acidithiobacillus thiooxidans]MDX5936342.1 peptide ABC transporter substrate-binding protein [Acidithiobacillus thiooxidans]TQN49657.1 Oligopeptide-binding protein AppA [Acidithiobacillus thiooxidans ATCC 19377]